MNEMQQQVIEDLRRRGFIGVYLQELESAGFESLTPTAEEQLVRDLLAGDSTMIEEEVLRLLPLSPTARGPIFEDILERGSFSDYRWALQTPGIPLDMARRFVERVSTSPNSQCSYWAGIILEEVTSLPDELKPPLWRRTHSLWRGTSGARRAISSFFGERHAFAPFMDEPRVFYRLEDGIPVFTNYQWEVIGAPRRLASGTMTEALLGCDPRGEWPDSEKPVRVLLCREGERSYAWEVNPWPKTLDGAIRSFLRGADVPRSRKILWYGPLALVQMRSLGTTGGYREERGARELKVPDRTKEHTFQLQGLSAVYCSYSPLVSVTVTAVVEVTGDDAQISGHPQYSLRIPKGLWKVVLGREYRS